MKRAIKAVKSLSKKDGINAYKEGKQNFENPTEEIEKLAQARLEICKPCEHFAVENVEWLRVKDKNLPEASKRYCEDCACVISYKIRQSKNKCKKWQEKE